MIIYYLYNEEESKIIELEFNQKPTIEQLKEALKITGLDQNKIKVYATEDLQFGLIDLVYKNY